MSEYTSATIPYADFVSGLNSHYPRNTELYSITDPKFRYKGLIDSTLLSLTKSIPTMAHPLSTREKERPTPTAFIDKISTWTPPNEFSVPGRVVTSFLTGIPHKFETILAEINATPTYRMTTTKEDARERAKKVHLDELFRELRDENGEWNISVGDRLSYYLVTRALHRVFDEARSAGGFKKWPIISAITNILEAMKISFLNGSPPIYSPQEQPYIGLSYEITAQENRGKAPNPRHTTARIQNGQPDPGKRK